MVFRTCSEHLSDPADLQLAAARTPTAGPGCSQRSSRDDRRPRAATRARPTPTTRRPTRSVTRPGASVRTVRTVRTPVPRVRPGVEGTPARRARFARPARTPPRMPRSVTGAGVRPGVCAHLCGPRPHGYALGTRPRTCAHRCAHTHHPPPPRSSRDDRDGPRKRRRAQADHSRSGPSWGPPSGYEAPAAPASTM